MRMLGLALALPRGLVACARHEAQPTGTGTAPTTEAAGGSGPGTTIAIVAISVLLLIVLLAANADSDPFWITATSAPDRTAANPGRLRGTHCARKVPWPLLSSDSAVTALALPSGPTAKRNDEGTPGISASAS